MATKPAEIDLGTRIVAAVTQGTAGAVVGAALSAVTEPLVNKILVERIPVMEAVDSLSAVKIASFFNTTIATNFIKFPFFEVTSVLMSRFDLPPTMSSAMAGAIFCSMTLPITNYRYCKSVGKPVEGLFKAYLPTVMRDIVYSVVRNHVLTHFRKTSPELFATKWGRFYVTFIAVMLSAVISSPGNEVRGYYLQDPATKKSPQDFFQPIRYLRSTSVGAMVMSTALGVGAAVTPPVQTSLNDFRGWAKNNQIESVFMMWLISQILNYNK